MSVIEITHFTDPGCPWAYSASPALAVLRWRYGAQLRWRLVTIGLTESADQYVSRGYTPVRAAHGYMSYRRFGMPFATAPRARIAGTARACRAIVATRLLDPEREYAVFRALQFGWFTSTLVLDDHADIATALAQLPGLDAAAIMGALDEESVTSAYEADRALARTAAGGPTEFQGKSATSDGPVRYTAPSLILSRGERRLEAGGFQPVEAYDLAIANLDTTLEREPPPESPLSALQRFPEGLVTQEVAAIMTHGNNAPDRPAAERALIELVGEGSARRVALGDDALWLVAQ
ncbi:MAG TPA: DsbA family protein [Solirubrobacteraceae bacterium]|jgi:protein-disulfide isomerase-like protein with CxxC motif|nr:DsbA family protein [Solirubrobacteraceae bacterium]